MIKNYLKLAFRSLSKNKLNAVIHIAGLALGLACFLLINEYVRFEKSYDDYHDHPSQLYRLTTDNVIDGKIQIRDAMSFAPSGKALEEDLPEVISSTTTYKTWRMIFRKDGQPVEEKWVTAVDSNFLDLFRYEILQSDGEDLLNEPYTMVLTESQADKYFPDQDPVGKEIFVLGNFNRPFQVTGVLRDIPRNSHYRFDVLVSLKSFEQRVLRDAWSGFNYYTYLQLDPRANPELVRAKLPELSRKYIGDESTLEFHLQPVRSIHLHSDFTYEPEIHGSSKAVYFLNIISILILLIAWVNYINLSTARALDRAKEVGLRKVVGATKGQLIYQFFSEALVINFFGALLALILAESALPYFHELVDKQIISHTWNHPWILSKLGIFFLLGTLVTGFYPAWVLSSYKPIQVLRGSFIRSARGLMLRKGLVVFQFASSLALIAASLVVYQQIRYMMGRDLGISTEQVVGISNPDIPSEQREEYRSKYNALLTEMSRAEYVEQVGSISNLPGGGSADISSSSGGVRIVGLSDRVESTVYIVTIDDQLQNTLQIELLAGRNFRREFAGDTATVIVNRSLLDMLNIHSAESVVNEYLQMGRNPENPRYQIIGVFNDYNRTTLKNTIEPTLFFYNEAPDNMVVALNTADYPSAMARIQEVWSGFFPESPFVYTMLDERFEQLYAEDKKLGWIFSNFALIAIIVALLGLFGLSSLISIQRTKEVGVRKVLGASSLEIVFLFFKDFMKLIAISILIGAPVVYLLMQDWLETYAYRIQFPWWVLLISLSVLSLLAFLTVGFQTYKTAIVNPADTLKHE